MKTIAKAIINEARSVKHTAIEQGMWQAKQPAKAQVRKPQKNDHTSGEYV